MWLAPRASFDHKYLEVGGSECLALRESDLEAPYAVGGVETSNVEEAARDLVCSST